MGVHVGALWPHPFTNMALELEEVDSFLNEFTKFTDSQRNGVKQLFLKLQNVSEVTIDFNSLGNCLDSIYPTEVGTVYWSLV